MRLPAPAASGQRGFVDALPPVPVPFAFVDDDFRVTIGMPVESTCISVATRPLAGRRCAGVPPVRVSQFAAGGGMLALVSSNESGKLVFDARFKTGLYAVADSEAALREAFGAPDVPPRKDESRTRLIGLPDGSAALHATFDVPPGDHPGIDHWVSLTVGGRRGLYQLSWLSNAARAAEADALALRTVASIVHQDDSPLVPLSSGPPNPERTIAAIHGTLKACYEEGLATEPTMKGNLEILLRLSANGRVRSATKSGGAGLSPMVEECLLAQMRPAIFDPPGPNGIQLTLPVKFVPGSPP